MIKQKSTSVFLVIPARGGSKGIPLKNLQKIGGISLIGRAVKSALAAELVDQVFISSDSQLILDESLIYGGYQHLRENSSASDNASTEDALNDFLLSFGEDRPDILVYLQCTSPFINGRDIDRAVTKLLENKELDTVFSAREYHGFLWRYSDDDTKDAAVGVNHDGYSQRHRRQDVNKTFIEDGSIYAMRVDRYLKAQNRFGDKANFIEVKNALPFEIDSKFELKLARLCEPAYTEKPKLYYAIKLLVSDFDGVMTSDTVYLNQVGVESVKCSRADGMGVGIMRKMGIETLILSTETNPVVAKRAEKLKISCVQGARNKLAELKKIALSRNLTANQIAYVGNDVNDSECLDWVGLPMIPNDANDLLKDHGYLRLAKNGGEGVIREIASILVTK
jgi:YrbI family 3-deoxy-D-manno-octulosonate 8-phosphate phosphatase